MQPATHSRGYLAWPSQPACKACQHRNSRQTDRLQLHLQLGNLPSQHLLGNIILHSPPPAAMEMRKKAIPPRTFIPQLGDQYPLPIVILQQLLILLRSL